MKRSSLLLSVLLPLLAAPAFAAPDLGVTCIQRGPLYWRYNVVYPDGVPQLAPTHGQDPAMDQHWPSPGDLVTFIAHVRNHGDSAAPGFTYRWYLDGQAQGPGKQVYAPPVPPGEEALVSLQSRWPADLGDHKVRIAVDPGNRIGDATRETTPTRTSPTPSASASGSRRGCTTASTP